ncbi:aflatoxin biosynthesis ketoreductase nor-1 [Apiospora saccharicola]|uniref:Aflatoxin biosynthesis ketoreductase nor-1 n=1 Tax=Apiospora saccharicola TaxID=335842 RepID=A0ABR1WKB1_9PEZI
MSRQPTTVFITGASRGIGRALVEAYLKRANHTVIASVRDPDRTPLKGLDTAEGSRLMVVKIEAKSAGDADAAVEQIKAEGITALDVVIAVAGTNPSDAWAEVQDLDPAQTEDIFQVNTFSFLKLLHAVYPLLKATADKAGATTPPKLLALSSNAGQIGDMAVKIEIPGMDPIPLRVGAYGASKAALNYFVRRAHLEHPWLACWMMNPGFVQTDTGNAHAEKWGIGKALHELGPTADKLMGKVDEATLEETAGKFLNFDGAEMSF